MAYCRRNFFAGYIAGMRAPSFLQCRSSRSRHPELKADEILDKMERISSGALAGVAHRVWQNMSERFQISWGWRGAHRRRARMVVAYLSNIVFDCLVSTGANLYHDLHEHATNPIWIIARQRCCLAKIDSSRL